MSRSPASTQWIALVPLALAAAVIAPVGLASPDAIACATEERLRALRAFSTADEVEWKSEQGVDGLDVYIESRWNVSRNDESREVAQILVSRDPSDFLLPPRPTLPSMHFPDDVTERPTLDDDHPDVRVALRVSRQHARPFAVGWILVLDGEPVDGLAGTLVRRAFAHPLDPPPPILLMSVDESGGSATQAKRRIRVMGRLAQLWRELSATCRS